MEQFTALILIEIMEEYESDYCGNNGKGIGDGCAWILIILGAIVVRIVMLLIKGGAE